MISCVYCGGEHARPAEVKQCWSRHEAGGDPASRVAPPPSPPPSPAPARSPAPAIRAATEERAGRTPLTSARRGPHELGRNVIVSAQQPPPDDWRDAPVVRADPEALAHLRELAHRRQGAVIELPHTGPAAAVAPPLTVDARDPWEIGVEASLDDLELHHLVWSNSIDARDGAAWSLVDRAVALGATPVADGAGDVEHEGRRYWLDGGPLRYHAPVDGADVVSAIHVEHGRIVAPGPNRTDAPLAPDQLAAVTEPVGVARIIAPAGSGKTRVLTERTRHLVEAWRVPTSAVCLVAFNKRAQEEMSERLADVPGVQVRTLNSIALAIVNGRPPFAPQPRSWRTIDEPDVRRLLQRHVSTRRRRNTDPLAPWIDALGLVRLGLVPPGEVEVRYGGDVDGLAEVAPAYFADLDRAGQVDFDGQIDRAIRVLLTDPAARAAAQRACRVLLVDEFQDLTPAHLVLVRLLAAPAGTVFGVGDDDQTIYGYNGADPGWLIHYDRWFPGAVDRPLEVNYRCDPAVVDTADRLLRHNRQRVAKTIRAAPGRAPGTDVLRVADEADTVAATVAAVRSAIESGRAPAEIAVLTRVNAVLAPVQVGLSLAGVPIASGVGSEFVERTAVRAALAWIRLATTPRFAADDLAEALRRPSRSLHPRIGEWVGEQRDLASLRALADRLTNERDATRVGELADDIEALRQLVERGASTAELVRALVDDIGLGGAVATLDATRRGMNRAAQGDDLLALGQLARLRENPRGFGGWLHDRLIERRDPAGVTLATVHRVKGQEWPTVVVHQADAHQYPHRLAEDVEEERRLFHVAITRARDDLVVVPGASPSPFVAELTTEPSDDEPPVSAHVAERRRPAAAASTGSRGAGRDHPLLADGVVGATVGLELVDQGQTWTIVDIEPTAAVAAHDGVTRRFGLGEKVETAGRQRGALGALPGEIEPASAVVFDRLRQWRDRARQGKPAYVVFDDKTLAALASALPRDLAEMSAVRGVGPAKLDQYGDDVLVLVADAIDAIGAGRSDDAPGAD